MKKKFYIIMTLIMVAVMFIGTTTYAWFKSLATSSVNTIRAGKLEIKTVDDTYPDPLLYVEKDYGIDGIFNSDKWYPGGEIGYRTWNIKNTGDFNAHIYGVSADVYNLMAPENSAFSKEQALKNFKNNFIITITKTQYGKVEQVFSGSLAQLRSIRKFTTESPNNKPIILKTKENKNNNAVMFTFDAKLSEEASDEMQGILANIIFNIHATQETANIDKLIK